APAPAAASGPAPASAPAPAACPAPAAGPAPSCPADLGIQLLGPSPCVISRSKGKHRWHILVKAPYQTSDGQPFDLSTWLSAALGKLRPNPQVIRVVDIDPYDMM
ncbi:MAG: hypothetical protein FWF71_02630, partial [Actinomycetia bacterium]|nr:hypothetical protein [Actinomycetes bacterium]